MLAFIIGHGHESLIDLNVALLTFPQQSSSYELPWGQSHVVSGSLFIWKKSIIGYFVNQITSSWYSYLWCSKKILFISSYLYPSSGDSDNRIISDAVTKWRIFFIYSALSLSAALAPCPWVVTTLLTYRLWSLNPPDDTTIRGYYSWLALVWIHQHFLQMSQSFLCYFARKTAKAFLSVRVAL